MQLHLVVMVRNEADIWAQFLAQASALFDRIAVIDNQSTDGTSEITQDFVKKGAPLDVYSYAHRAYAQRELSNAFARHGFKNGADWVFFLDADEFIEVPDRSVLERGLWASRAQVVSFSWKNLVPTAYGSFENFDLTQDFRWTGVCSRLPKVALSKTFASRFPDFQIYQGNHTVSAGKNENPVPADEIGTIVHIPIRSIERFRYKLAWGVAAYKALQPNQTVEGFHWFDLHRRMEAGAVDIETLNGLVADYGEPIDRAQPVDPVSANWPRLKIKSQRTRALPQRRFCLEETKRRDLALVWDDLHIFDRSNIAVSIANGSVKLQPQAMHATGEIGPSVFEALPISPDETPHAGVSSNPTDFAEALEPIQTLVPSAWSQHAPFLLSLISLLQPRRHVEIGSHFGMSFLAACQAVQECGLQTQCIAIDSWMGDHQAGFYDSSGFEQFTYLLRTRYPKIGYYIRCFFNDALACFADGSIDLLHIDGPHTYKAVKADYERWLPKMSDRGVILFHDITVYDGDFGVWRLLRDIEQRHPTFNFHHTHGLGIAYVGREQSPIADLLRRIRGDEKLDTLINYLFRGIGKLSISRGELAQRATTLEDERNRLAGEAAEARARLSAILTSRSRKLTEPFRLLGRIRNAVMRRLHGR
jgi:predicted O-methyltransferase YrrM